MSYTEDDYIRIYSIERFAFCRRQWALVELEQQWGENLHTLEGDIFHERVHDDGLSEKRGDLLIVRGMRVHSATLGISGACDVVEFHADESGVELAGRTGKWLPYPVEYKRGHGKEMDGERLQLCAQAMCLEEMLCCNIPEGALFYGETRRRERVAFTEELRGQVRGMLEEMREYQRRGYTPKVKTGPHCRACSVQEVCLPRLNKAPSVSAYIQTALMEKED